MTETPETPETPETLHPQRERGRMTTMGRRTDGGGGCLLLVVHEADGSWTIHGLGEVGIRLTPERMAVLAGEILVRTP